MNTNVLRALAADAYHQVLDNWVFRILTVLALIPILFTFAVGLREDEVVLLFGMKAWSYESLFSSLHAGLLPPDPQGTVIGFLLNLCFEFLAGSLGLLLTIAATAFFVPRMLEKGAAELYFHKPVSRSTLYLSRYFAGLLFIGLASSVLVGGMYLGLALVSGYQDPAILVAALQITYVFALVHSFSMLVGVLTRSTVASILLTSFFFLFNGCVQQSWITMQRSDHGPDLRLELGRKAEEREEPEPATDDARADSSEDSSEEQATKEEPAFLVAIRRTLDVLHLVLPKTTDADFLARKLRRAIGRPEFRDADSLVFVPRLSSDLRRLEPAELATLSTGALPRESLGEARFAVATGEPPARLSLWRRPAEVRETRIGERVRKRVETTSRAAQALEGALEGAGQRPERESTRFGTISGGQDIYAQSVHWEEHGIRHEVLVFRGASGDWIYALLVVPDAPLDPQGQQALVHRLSDRVGFDLASVEEWYPQQLGFDSALPYNILFSVGSSVAFALLLLGLGIWRLGRVAF